MSQHKSTDYAGIDYGSFAQSNRDKDTGIHFGVIPSREVGQSWYDSAEADYGDPACPQCGNEVSADIPDDDTLTPYHAYSCHDYVCLSCRTIYDSADVYGDEPIGHTFTDDDYELSEGSDGDIFVIRSPFYTRAQFCSPCAPGAGYLLNPCESGPKTYALGHDWFEDQTAPYRVFRVSDDSEVMPESAE